jgi:hypothetical protein
MLDLRFKQPGATGVPVRFSQWHRSRDPLRLRHRLTPPLRRSDGRGPTGPASAPRLVGGLTPPPALRHAADHPGLSTLSLRSRRAPSGPRPSERLRYDPLKQIGLDDERRNQRGPPPLLNSP